MLAALPGRALRLLAVALMALAGFAAAQQPPATEPAPAAEVPAPLPPPPPDSEGVVWNMTPPEYPFHQLRQGIGGVVMLRVEIDAEGRVLNVVIDQSSGNYALDKAAVDAAGSWKFMPSVRDGVPVGGFVMVPVKFTPTASG